MRDKTLLIAIALIMVLIASVPVAVGQIPRPKGIIIVTIGEPETIDPAWLYDTASAEICQHIYETLIFFNVTRDLTATDYLVDPTTAGRTDQFVGAIADSWAIKTINETDPETGLTWVERWVFHIREGVLFHDGDTVTPQDVEYTFERWMVQDRSGGPTWMILEPTTGYYAVDDLIEDYGVATTGKIIDHAVESNTTHVWFNLVMPYAPFPTIIAQSWAGILSYDWCTSINDWPGTGVAFEDRWGDYTGWTAFHDPEVSPIDKAYSEQGIKPVGAGPYKLDYWTKGVEWRIVKFDNYYRGWPAPINPDNPGAGRLPDYIESITEKFVDEWATRKMMFLAGDADFCYVPRMHISELILNWGQEPEQYPEGLRCYKNLPLLTCSPVMFFTYNISTTSPFLGVPGGLPPGTYDESGIPPDFFNDIKIRKAFAYAFNYTKYLQEVYMGEAAICPTPIIEGLPFYDPTITADWFPEGNLTKAEELLKQVPGLWENGFTIGLSYNTGNVARQKACEMIKANIENLNEKFHVNIYPVDWPTYLGHLVASELSCFILGWLADFPDPHNFAMPFMHTQGDFSCFQYVQYGQSGHTQIRYYVNGVPYGNPGAPIDNDYVDEMIENGVKTTNETEREIIYKELQRIYVDECPSVPLCKPTGRHWERDWMHGWYYNPIYPGVGYYYHMWKATPATWLPVDISAVDTLTPIQAPPEIVQIFEGRMLYGGEDVTILYNFTVHRVDSYSEPATVLCAMSLYRNETVPEGTVSDYFWLRPGESYWEALNWTTPPDEMSTGLWIVSGKVVVISGTAYDENPDNNVVTDGSFEAVELKGDVTGDGIVDIYDAITFAKAFGGGEEELGGIPEKYNPLCDLNGDGIIDIYDAILLAGNFGKSIP